MFLVMDADMLLLVGNDVSLIKGYRRAILTPNVVEFKRLSDSVVSLACHRASFSASLTQLRM